LFITNLAVERLNFFLAILTSGSVPRPSFTVLPFFVLNIETVEESTACAFSPIFLEE